MSWVGESVHAGKVRDSDMDQRSAARYAVNFLHYSYDIIEMFENVRSINSLERIIRKWPRRSIEVVDYIGCRFRSAVKVDGVFHSFSTAAQIQDVVMARAP